MTVKISHLDNTIPIYVHLTIHATKKFKISLDKNLPPAFVRAGLVKLMYFICYCAGFAEKNE
jgi:hypothetical protein